MLYCRQVHTYDYTDIIDPLNGFFLFQLMNFKYF